MAGEHTRQDFATLSFKFTRGFLQTDENVILLHEAMLVLCCDFSELRAWDGGSSEGGRSLVLIRDKRQ